MPDVYIRTLVRAAEIAGGTQELAFKLRITPSHLSLWMAGLEPCPTEVFLKAVDLVLEREIAAQRTQAGNVEPAKSEQSAGGPRTP